MKKFLIYFKTTIFFLACSLIIQNTATANSIAPQEQKTQVLSKVASSTSITEKRVLDQYDQETIYQILQDEIPELKIHSIKLISNGWDNFVADIKGALCGVESQWIFRFPRHREDIAGLEQEETLLNQLKGKVEMPIPDYEFIGRYTAFVGYRKILGCPLTEQRYLSLSDKSRQDVAQSLAVFFSQLHAAISVNEALAYGYMEYTLDLTAIEPLLGKLPSSQIELMIVDALSFAKQQTGTPQKLVLLHNDLHGDNIAFDLQTKTLNGVFDFSDAVIGDYMIDFGCLFTIHSDLATRTIKHYHCLNNVSNEAFVPSLVDQILRQAFYLAQARNLSDTSRESQIILCLEQLIPAWETCMKST